MLNSVNDYVLNRSAVISAGINIAGNIIPRQDVYGLAHPLRREDLAYLAEAIAERRGRAYSWNATRNIYADGVLALGSGIRALYSGAFLDPGFDFYVDPRVCDVDTIITDAFNGCMLETEDCTIPEYVGSSLSCNYLRHCFWNVNRLNRKYLNAEARNTRSGYVHVQAYGWSGGAHPTQNDESGTVYMPDEYGWPGGTRITVQSGNYYLLRSSDVYDYENGFALEEARGDEYNHFEISYQGNLFARFSSLAELKSDDLPMVYCFRAHDIFEASLTQTEETIRDVFIAVSGHVIRETGDYTAAVRGRMDSDIYRAVLLAAFSFTPFDTDQLHTPGRHNYRLEFRGAFPIVQYQYRSEIDSLGWSWRP